MKPKRIKVTGSCSKFVETGKVYDVVEWDCERPKVKDEFGDLTRLTISKWEPVQDFNNGDPVWAWDDPEYTIKGRLRSGKQKRFYVGKNPKCHISKYVVVNEKGSVGCYTDVEHRKPTITLKELA